MDHRGRGRPRAGHAGDPCRPVACDPTTGAVDAADLRHPRPTPSPARACTRASSTRARTTRTRFAYERCVAGLEGGSRGFAFASGLAATSRCWNCSTAATTCSRWTTSTAQLPPVRTRAPAQQRGPDFSFVDDPIRRFEARSRPGRSWWIETPTNPLLKIVDIATIAAIMKKRGLRSRSTTPSPRRRCSARSTRRRIWSCIRRRNTQRPFRTWSAACSWSATTPNPPSRSRSCRTGRRGAGAVRQLPRPARPEDAAPSACAHCCARRWQNGCNRIRRSRR